MRLRKTLTIVICQWQADQLFAAETYINWSARHYQNSGNMLQKPIPTIVYQSITIVFIFILLSEFSLWELVWSNLQFFMSVVTIMHEQNIICSLSTEIHVSELHHQKVIFTTAAVVVIIISTIIMIIILLLLLLIINNNY